MSTITRESAHVALPQVGRGDAVFCGLAVVVAILALIAKLAGVFA